MIGDWVQLRLIFFKYADGEVIFFRGKSLDQLVLYVDADVRGGT